MSLSHVWLNKTEVSYSIIVCYLVTSMCIYIIIRYLTLSQITLNAKTTLSFSISSEHKNQTIVRFNYNFCYHELVYNTYSRDDSELSVSCLCRYNNVVTIWLHCNNSTIMCSTSETNNCSIIRISIVRNKVTITTSIFIL